MVSLAVELGRTARVVGAGVGVAPPAPEQAPRSRMVRAARASTAGLGWGCGCIHFTCYLICWVKLAVIGGPLWGVALMVRVVGPGWRSRLAAKWLALSSCRSMLCFCPNGVVMVALAPSMGCSLPFGVKKVKWAVLAPGRPGSR
jgi:hypothetical protein